MAVLVANGGNDDAGPKRGAVPADAPTFIFKTSNSGGNFEFFFGNFGTLRFRRIKHPEMPANDFVRFITFDAFRARIPRLHFSSGCEEKNRVIGDLIDQQPKRDIAGRDQGVQFWRCVRFCLFH